MTELTNQPNIAEPLIDWDLRREGVEGSIASLLRNDGVESGRADELAGEAVDALENLDHVVGIATTWQNEPDSDFADLTFQLSGTIRIRVR